MQTPSAKATPRYDPASIRALFDEMAGTYGFMNLITSFSFAALWRHQAIRHLPRNNPTHVIDLMSGMGELWHCLSRQNPTITRVTAIDLSPEMTRRSPTHLPFILDLHVTDVLTWNPTHSADAIVCSFGLKTFDASQQAALAALVARLLRPGGTFSFVEISVPTAPLLKFPYMFYLKHVIPFLGRLFLGNPANYRMLGAYTAAFRDCSQFSHDLRTAGLNVSFERYFFGCATGVCGNKPDVLP